jgi:3-hydroxyisobutyrate dehydrogenase-like beta-hydroxyacid dehydrogenase
VTDGMPTLGFVGLGAMGSRMASRLLRAGYPVTVHDARPEAATALVAEGAAFASTPREVADAAEVVLVSLPSPQVALDVVAGESGLCGGASMRCFIDLSTTGPQVAGELAQQIEAAGAAYVDAPVSGGPAGAESGALTLMVAGSPAAVASVKPILEELGSKILVVGDRPGQGQLVKVINNLMSASAIAITAEALALGVKAGLAPEVLLEVVGASSGSNTAVTDKFPRQVLTRKFDHGFRLELMAKDVRLCLEEARRRSVPMLLGGTVDQLWALAEQQGEPGDDCTAIAQMFEEWAGTTIVGGAA